MKKFILVLFVGVIVSLPFLTSAAQFKASNTVTIGEEPKGQNSYAAGGTVRVTGPVDGDLVAAGGTVTVDGIVNRDATLGGGTIVVSSEIKEDLRIAGGDVTVSGPVGGELSAVGGEMRVAPGAQVAGDTHLIGGTVSFEGATAGTLIIRGGDVFIDGAVAKDVVIQRAHSVHIGPHAVVRGTLRYSAPEEAQIDDGASLLSGVTFEQQVSDSDNKDSGEQGWFFGLLSVWILIKLIGGWILALLLLALWRPSVMAMQRDTRDNFWWRVLYGFCMLILVPIAAIIVMFTVVGIIPGVIALLLYATLLLVGGVYAIVTVASLLNEFVFKKRYADLPWFMPLLASLVMLLVYLIPFVGCLAVFIVFLAGLGTLSRGVVGLIKPQRQGGTA